MVGHDPGRGRDSDARARELVDSIEIRFEPKGDRLTVVALYPLDRYRATPIRGEGDDGADVPWPLSWLIESGSSSTVTYRGERVTVVGRAVGLGSDALRRLPDRGARRHGGAGQERGRRDRVERRPGDQSLDTASGDVMVERRAPGALRVDTGSGDVTVTGHEGDVSVDTGSGDVRLERVRGATIVADTGSGNVELIAVRGAIDADTGSGDVIGNDLVLGARLRADTGSGDVRLAGRLLRRHRPLDRHRQRRRRAHRRPAPRRCA